MKVTVYTRDGDVIQEVDCVNVYPQAEGYMMVVLSKRDALKTMLGTGKTDPCFVTNMPLHVDGADIGRAAPIETDVDRYTISMHGRDGAIIHCWESSRDLVYSKGALNFWHEGRWHTLTGDVIAQLEESANA